MHQAQKLLTQPFYRKICETALFHINLGHKIDEEELNVYHEAWADFTIGPITENKLGIVAQIMSVGYIYTQNDITPMKDIGHLVLRAHIALVPDDKLEEYLIGKSENPCNCIETKCGSVIIAAVEWLVNENEIGYKQVGEKIWTREFQETLEEVGLITK